MPPAVQAGWGPASVAPAPFPDGAVSAAASRHPLHQTCFQTHSVSQCEGGPTHASLSPLPCQPQGWHCGFQNLITGTTSRPRSSLLRGPALSFLRIHFCSSQLKPFDVRNDEAVKTEIDTSEEDGGGRPQGTGKESSMFLVCSPTDTARQAGRGWRRRAPGS